MKVQRYTKGATNVAELQSQAAAVISPEEAAAAAAAPYEAAGKIAGVAADQLTEYGMRRIEEENKNDAMASALNMSNYKNTTEANRKQAIAENWSPELFEANQGAVDKAFMGSAELISPRNRDQVTKTYRTTMAGTQLETALLSSEIKRGKLVQDYETQRFQAAQNKEYETMLFLDDMAHQSGFIDNTELMKRNVQTDAMIKGNTLGLEYADSVQAGTEDQFMEKVGAADYNDETLSAFGVEKAKVDFFDDQLKKEQKIEKGIEYQKFLHSIDQNTPIEMIDDYARDSELNGDQISRMYTRKYKQDQSEDIATGIWADSGSATNRRAMNGRVKKGETVEETLLNAVGVTTETGISPEMLSTGLENLAQTNSAQDIATAGEAYIRYGEVAHPIPLPMNDYATSKLEYYKQMRNDLGQDPANASTAAVARFADVTESTIKVNRQAWNAPKAGSDGKTSPAELVNDAVKKLIIEPDGPLMNRMIGKERFGLDINFKNMQIPPELQAQINTIGENMYGITGSEQIATNSILRVLVNNEWAATDINKDIKATDTNDYSYQYQRKPVTIVKGRVVPVQKPRSLLSNDMGQIKFNVDFMNSKARAYSINELEFGEGEDDPNRSGRLRWPIKYRGGNLRFSEGENINQILYFWYPDKVAPEDQPEITERQSTGMEGTTVDPRLFQ